MEAAKVTTLVGEFRNLDRERKSKLECCSNPKIPASHAAFSNPDVGATLLESSLKSTAATTLSSRFVGKMYKQEKEKLFYIFVPPGKWRYNGKMEESDSHVFTATVLFDELVVAQQDSVLVHIVRM